jgi:glycosyltransferase involved in cell wall biosynthesis
MNSKVSILLSTYNSEKFLKEQLDSLLEQSYPSFQILLRDDGSTDSTLTIIHSYNDTRIKILETDGTNLGTIQSFSRLLEQDDSDYFFFCDHDDIWMKDKVKIQIEQIQMIEKERGQELPILVHSDLEIITDTGNSLAPSMWSFGKFYTERKKLSQLIVQGTVTGCAMAGNKKLREMISPIPMGVVMHDWWASLVASAFGCIYSDPIPTLQYRVHAQNQIGVIKPSLFQIWDIIKKPEKHTKFFNESFSQAEALLTGFSDKLNSQDRETLEVYCNLLKKNRFLRVYLAIKHGFIRSTLYRNGLYYLVLFLH